jgi:hypothetical protein
MEHFKNSIVESIKSTNEEFKTPSRQYTKNDLVFMAGYKCALQEILEELIQFQLN